MMRLVATRWSIGGCNHFAVVCRVFVEVNDRQKIRKNSQLIPGPNVEIFITLGLLAIVVFRLRSFLTLSSYDRSAHRPDQNSYNDRNCVDKLCEHWHLSSLEQYFW